MLRERARQKEAEKVHAPPSYFIISFFILVTHWSPVSHRYMYGLDPC